MGQLDVRRAAIGLCLDCVHAKVIRSDRGTVFYRCQLSDTDSRFPKYPRLPVETCAGYEADEQAPKGIVASARRHLLDEGSD
jgi:hypothetical protein